jgi:hypothetical protein
MAASRTRIGTSSMVERYGVTVRVNENETHGVKV